MKKIALFLILLSGSFAAMAQSSTEALETTPAINGYVTNIAYGDGKVFLQGDFTWLGEPYGGTSVVFNETLTRDASYPDDIWGFAAIPDDAGGWYVRQYSTIAHVKADKTVEQLPIEADNSYIYAMVKTGNVLYFGGQFTSVNGTARNRLAAFNLSTNTLTGWNPSSNGTVYALAVYGSTVYAGGSFTTIGGQTRNKIAALDANTGLATAWNVGMSSSTSYHVYAIAANENTVFFGGNFFLSGSNFAARDAATGTVNSFSPSPNARVGELLLDGNTLYISGAYTQIAGVDKKYISTFNITTGTLTPFHVELNYYSNSGSPSSLMSITGDKLFIGGQFNTVNNTPHHYLVVVNKHTGALEPMNEDTYLSDNPDYVVANNGKILVGRAYGFRGIKGIPRQRLAALDHNTGKITEWNPEISSDDGYAENIQYQQNRVYIHQQNYTYTPPSEPDIYTTKLSAVNTTDGAVIPGWGVTIDGQVYDWAFSESAVYVAGSFTEINGQTRNGFAALDLQTGNLLPWTISFTPSSGDDGEGYYAEISLATDNNVVYMSYNENNWNTGTRNTTLAAWNAATGAALSWAPPDMNDGEYWRSVTIRAVHGNYVYLMQGGGVLRVDKVTGQADGWKPTLNGKDISEDGYGVNTIAIHGNYVYLGGAFPLDDDWQEWKGVLRANINTGIISDWQPSLYLHGEGSVSTLAITETKLLVGGGISHVTNGITKDYYAEYLLPDDFETPESGDIVVYNAISVNGDSQNDRLRIQNIEAFANNNVTIYNRWGDVVWEGKKYNNTTIVFRGLNKNGNELAAGTYFYRIEFASNVKPLNGYLSLKR